MNLKLVTTGSYLYGIFGEYYPLSGGDRICVTLEHAYSDGKGGWTPKLARGQTYTCKRGTGPVNGLWKLKSGMVLDAFQVMDVPMFQGFPVTDLLAGHPGNWGTQSEGCVLTGTSVNLGIKMILESDAAFKKFMDSQEGVDEFQLMVV